MYKVIYLFIYWEFCVLIVVQSLKGGNFSFYEKKKITKINSLPTTTYPTIDLSRSPLVVRRLVEI
jgi:hypothetical protein